MQGCGAVFDVQVHHDGGALPVRSSGHIAVPTGLDQAQEPVDGTGQRWRLVGHVVGAVAFPVGDQGVGVRLQGGVEGGRLVVGEGDLPRGGLKPPLSPQLFMQFWVQKAPG